MVLPGINAGTPIDSHRLDSSPREPYTIVSYQTVRFNPALGLTLTFLFANTSRGAQSSAVIFSLIETAKENGLEPYRYLVWALTEAPKRFCSSTDWAASLIPQNAPDCCRTAVRP